jgi:REP element-mobilizing transposase RayT
MGHTFSNLLAHVIFSTKDRRSIITDAIAEKLYAYMAGVARKEFGWAKRIGGVGDHVHGLIELRTDVSMAHAMNRWKSLSSRWIHRTFPELRDFAWQSGYGVFAVSSSKAPDVIAYIDAQAEHHKHRSFEEEFVDFLKRHEIQFDPDHIWE